MGKSNKDQSRYGDDYSSPGSNSYESNIRRPEVVSPGYDTGQRYTIAPKDRQGINVDDHLTTHRAPGEDN